MKKTFLSFMGMLWALCLMAQTYKSDAGNVFFKSEAPLEVIEANSSKLRCAVNAATRTFAFSVETASFKGFNSPLQKEHFNENYLDAEKYPQSTFAGKIIEQIDLSKPGTYTVRAKGILTIHGVAQERILKSTVVVSDKTMKITSEFTVLLSEHKIALPKIVNQKIAEEVKVKIVTNLST